MRLHARDPPDCRIGWTSAGLAPATEAVEASGHGQEHVQLSIPAHYGNQ